MLLETYTTLPIKELKQRLPNFLDIGSEVTGDPAFSMFNLSLKDQWENNKKFCIGFKENDEKDSNKVIQDAKDSLEANRSKH